MEVIDLEKKIKIGMMVMAMLTLIYIATVVFVNANIIKNMESEEKKYPYQYGINLEFMAELTNTPRSRWYTPEELGIQLEGDSQGLFVSITDPDKALPWMKSHDYHFFSIKYEGKFYNLITFHVFPGKSYPVDYLVWGQIAGGIFVASGWCILGVIYWRKTQ